MRRKFTLLAVLAALLTAGCAPVDPHAQQSNVQMETGHVDSGGGGGGGGGSM